MASRDIIKRIALACAVITAINLSKHSVCAQEQLVARPSEKVNVKLEGTEFNVEQGMAEVMRQIEHPEDLESLSAEHLRRAIQFRRQGRLVVLQRRLLAIREEYELGIGGRAQHSSTTLGTVLEAEADLLEAKLEYVGTPQARIDILRARLASIRQSEREMKAKLDAGALHGSFATMMETVASRLKVEERLANELLSQKASSNSAGLATSCHQPAPACVRTVVKRRRK